MENTYYNAEFSNKYYQKYYCIIIQYSTKMNTMKLERQLRDMYNQNTDTKITAKHIHLRLLKDDEAHRLTGY